MLYNGNGFGATGIGHAVLERTEKPHCNRDEIRADMRPWGAVVERLRPCLVLWSGRRWLTRSDKNLTHPEVGFRR